MENYIITFRSVTPAQRGEAMLQRVGVSCRLQRTPRWMEAQGCGYSLHVKSRDISGVIEMLRDKKVPFRKVYRQTEGGTAEEIRL